MLPVIEAMISPLITQLSSCANNQSTTGSVLVRQHWIAVYVMLAIYVTTVCTSY